MKSHLKRIICTLPEKKKTTIHSFESKILPGKSSNLFNFPHTREGDIQAESDTKQESPLKFGVLVFCKDSSSSCSGFLSEF